MVNIKKINLLVCSLLMVLTSLFFVACTNNSYNDVTLSSSTASVTLDVGQEEEIVFTINNMLDKMDNSLNIAFSPEGIASCDIISQNGTEVTAKVKGIEAGTTILTATTIEGGKSCSLTVNVKQYSSFVSASEESLYVSSSSQLIVSTNDFVFEDKTSEKTLNYYFYGKNNGYTLSLDNVSSSITNSNGEKEREFKNQFVSVKLINQNGLSYLVFSDKNGDEFVLNSGNADISLNGNIKYSFISVSNNNGIYNIPLSASYVNIGDKFTFVANYENAKGDEIFTQREFIVLKDIDKDLISSSYGYLILDKNLQSTDQTYFEEDFSTNSITLVPNYTSALQENFIDFKQAKYVITVTGANDLLKYKFSFDENDLFNVSAQTTSIGNDKIYTFLLSTKTQVECQTNFNVTFYYDGFEDSKDENVSFTYTIPLIIKNKPNSIVISGSNFSNLPVDEKTFVFYNNYQSDSAGWQKYYFDVFPLGSSFEYLSIYLPQGCGLMIRYKGNLFTEGQTAIIDELDNFVEFKGVNDSPAESGLSLTVELSFNILREDSLTTKFNYEIKKGSTILKLDDDYSHLSSISISLNNDDDGVDISQMLYTDASFDDLSIGLISGVNNVKFELKDDICIENYGKFYLNLSLVPVKMGRGVYSISLPNGLATSITIDVVESLNTLAIETTNKNANMNIVDFDQDGATIYARFNTEDEDKQDRNSFDLQLVANSDSSSQAILSYETLLQSQDIITISNINGESFDVNLFGVGSSFITLTVRGYSVENFVAKQIEKTFVLNVVGYEYLKDFVVTKNSDGQGYYSSDELPINARYVYLYNNKANLTEQKQASLNVDVSYFNEITQSYLFKNHLNNQFEENKFDLKYVFWTVPGYTILLDGEKKEFMSMQENSENIYQITLQDVVIATFDTQNLLLTLAPDASANVLSFSLIANIDQYEIARKSYTVNVKILDYDAVESLSTISPVSSLEFSSLDKSHEINLRVLQNSAINKNIRVSITGDSVTFEGKKYNLFGDTTIAEAGSGIQINGNGGSVVNVSLVADEEFLQKANSNQNFFGGKPFIATLTIAAEDWYDDTGKLVEENKNKVVTISITFSNGSKENPFTIDSTEDLLSVKDNLSAHYKVTTTIDASSIDMPLGELKGSIVGDNEYAVITGINISKISQSSAQAVGENNYNYGGLFTSIAEGAIISNLKFEGKFDLNIDITNDTYLGIIAGINYGQIYNVSVTVDSSKVTITGNNNLNTYIGGLVGLNEGTIEQNFVSNDSESFKLFDYTLFMNDFLNIDYTGTNLFAGGIAGQSNGIIKKVDGQSTYAGYSNYLSYALINAYLSKTDTFSTSYIGSVAGKIWVNNIDSGLFATNNDQKYVVKPSYNYIAGKGIVVGGEVSGLNYVGGVVGQLEITGNANNTGSETRDDYCFAGITSRTFVRKQTLGKGEIGLLTGQIINNSDQSISPLFFMQAVDDGKVGEEASMLVIYLDDNSLSTDVENIDFNNLNKLAFGQDSALTTFDQYTSQFVSYITREQNKIEDENQSIAITQDLDKYYGEAVAVQYDKIVKQHFFSTKGGDLDLGVTENATLNNQMSIDEAPTQAYFAYYFSAVSTQLSDSEQGLAEAQNILDQTYNTLSVGDPLYPITILGELTLQSSNTSILKIDQNGEMTILGTGWVQVWGSSILNINEGVSFLIYVTNYFNVDSAKSIIYPNSSSDATALDDATIKMYSNQTVNLYVRPDYSFDGSDYSSSDSIENNFTIDSYGQASLGGFNFQIAKNNDVSAKVSIIVETNGNEKDSIEASSIEESNTQQENEEFDVSVAGQLIVITKKQSDSAFENANLIISPRLKVSYNGNIYTCDVNKTLSSINIDYQKGAVGIGASKYDNVAISTTNQINETIYLRTTANVDKNDPNSEGLLYYITFGNKIIQSNDAENYLEYIDTNKDKLFLVTIGDGVAISDEGYLIKEYSFDLNVIVNKNSEAYKNRFENNIYGDYKIVVLAKSNRSQYVTINISLENLPLQNIVIDNYNDQDKMTSSNGVGISSSYSYVGENSLLAITLNPEDSDFDYLIIENAQSNYSSGNGVGTFAVAARKNNPEDNKNLFDSSTIVGSATDSGLLITKEEIIDFYNQTTEIDNGDGSKTTVRNYKTYDGVIYFIYNIGNNGVVNNSISTFNIRVYKDNQEIAVKNNSIDLTLKLKNYISLSIDGKESETGLVNTYRVARGLSYKININSYGFNNSDISAPAIVSGSQYGSIVQENGEYYLQITSSSLGANAKIEIEIEAVRYDGDKQISATGNMTLLVMNYVIDENLADGEKAGNKDIIDGMVDGVITLPIGNSKNLAVDIYDYIEYDKTNQSVVDLVDQFVNDLTYRGTWSYYTNIAYGQSVPGSGSGEAKYEYDLLVDANGENYYFKYDNLVIVPIRINEADANLYYFKYQSSYRLSANGTEYIVVSNSSNASTITTEIRFEVFVSSSTENPIPIFDYEDFIDMKEGGNYILLNDITLPSKEFVENNDSYVQYQPQVASFASFDGNGNSIILDGTYDFGSATELGIFSSLKSGSVIKNLNVTVVSSYDTGNADFSLIFKTTTAEHRTGLLVGNNNGIITNCKVLSEIDNFFTVDCTLGSIESAYVGSLVGENNGYITNCSSSLNIYGSFNIAGIAGINNGKIAACSYKEGILQSSDDQIDEGFHVAGLVNVNNSGGQIITSYVSGGVSSDSLYSTNTASYLSGPNYSAGFVYENNGSISDCYSDIYLARSANMAGFVYVNTGNIKNSFSLSILQNNSIASAGFAMRNTPFDQEEEAPSDESVNQSNNSGQGTFENCYYLSYLQSINIDLNPIVFEGVSAIDDFSIANEAFKDYAYSDYVSTNAVWFYSGDDKTNSNYIAFVPTNNKSEINNGNGYGTQINTTYEIESIFLPKGRLELVAPNIESLSIRNFVDADVDSATGNITYNYQYDISTDATRKAEKGSLYNPYLIYSAETMESLILENSSANSNQNTSNYRMISDIDYSNYSSNSQIYKTVFAGNFEGNGMEISSIVLQSNEHMDNAGLFASLGISAGKMGVIKNIILSPSTVIFAGTSSVGALVGYVRNGEIYNVEVKTQSSLTVQGANFVGGIIGRAEGNYVLKNLNSNVNAVANYTPTLEQRGVYYKENLSTLIFSYAGGVAGYLGSGYAQNMFANEILTVRGDRAGFAVGGIGQSGNVCYVYVTPSTSSAIKAYSYGGLVVGEVVGKISEAVVYSNGQEDSPIFSIVGQVPSAVGGIAGVLSGGIIENVISYQSFAVDQRKIGTSSTYSTIDYVGGIVGTVANSGATVSTISKAIVEGNISASKTLGGAVGGAQNEINLDQIAVKCDLLQVNGQNDISKLGGIVGAVSTNPTPKVTITNSYCQANLIVEAQNALNVPSANVGGLIADNTNNVDLKNCYTSSKISLTLRYLNEMWEGVKQSFFELTEDVPVPYYHQITTSVSNNGVIENVYYYGCGASSGVNTVSQFVSCESNFKVETSNTSINNYGTDSRTKGDTGASSINSNTSALYDFAYEINLEVPDEAEEIKVKIGDKEIKSIAVQEGKSLYTAKDLLGDNLVNYINKETGELDKKIQIDYYSSSSGIIQDKSQTISFEIWSEKIDDFKHLLFENDLFWI